MRNPATRTAAAILRDVVRHIRAHEHGRKLPASTRAVLIDCADRAIRARRLIEGRAR